MARKIGLFAYVICIALIMCVHSAFTYGGERSTPYNYVIKVNAKKKSRISNTKRPIRICIKFFFLVFGHGSLGRLPPKPFFYPFGSGSGPGSLGRFPPTHLFHKGVKYLYCNIPHVFRNTSFSETIVFVMVPNDFIVRFLELL